VLRHLGIKPGEKIELERLPDGRITLHAAKSAGTIGGLLGLIAGKMKKVASPGETNEAAAAGWASEA